jgi:5-methylcytosine-specific restriction enzyme A
MSRTGFTAHAAEMILARSEGSCEVMSRVCVTTASDMHHRRARGMGGTKRLDTNLAANGLAICRRCHMYVESERQWAINKGFLVRQDADPEYAPIHWRLSQWCLLKADGTREILGNRDMADRLW